MSPILALFFIHRDNARTNRLIITLIAVLSLSWGIKLYKVGPATNRCIPQRRSQRWWFSYRQYRKPPSNYGPQRNGCLKSMVCVDEAMFTILKNIKLDSILGAYRFEDALEKASRPKIFRKHFSRMMCRNAINHRFFLVGNAEVDVDGIERHGRTQALADRFNRLLQSKAIVAVDAYPLWPSTKFSLIELRPKKRASVIHKPCCSGDGAKMSLYFLRTARKWCASKDSPNSRWARTSNSLGCMGPFWFNRVRISSLRWIISVFVDRWPLLVSDDFGKRSSVGKKTGVVLISTHHKLWFALSRQATEIEVSQSAPLNLVPNQPSWPTAV